MFANVGTGPRDETPQGEEAPGFKVPSLPTKARKGTHPFAFGQGGLNRRAAEDELAWLNSAGTDATGAAAPQASSSAPSLNSEESSLIDKLLGKKVADDLDEDTSKRYFGQDAAKPAKEEKRKEPEDATAELVYDDDGDELESFLSSKKKQPARAAAPATPSAPLPPAAAAPATKAPLAAAEVSASAAPEAASKEGADKEKDKKVKAKSSFKF